MITREEILEFAGQWTLTPPIVEKDYVIGWLLHGIYQHPSLSSDLLFKGGTCLKKCYFETYRFSEDLDFTVTNPELLNEDFLKSAFTEVAVHIYEQSGVEIPEDILRFDFYTNPNIPSSRRSPSAGSYGPRRPRAQHRAPFTYTSAPIAPRNSAGCEWPQD